MSFFTALVTSKIAVSALAAGTLAVGGTAAAAYTGVLPAPLQQSAHSLIGAPAPEASAALDAQATAEAEAADEDAAATDEETEEETEESTETELPEEVPAPVGPDATGPAAYGLCQSFTSGGLDTSSVGLASLAVAADGESNIADYCATVPSPGESGSHRPDDAGAASANIPAAPQLPAQAVVPAAPQQAATGTSSKPAPAGRP